MPGLVSEVRTDGVPRLPWPVELEPAVIADRFRWGRRRGHPRYVWPEVEPTAWRSALRELGRATTAVLCGGGYRLDGGGPAGSRALGVAGFTSGLGPLVGTWIEAGVVEADALTARVYRAHLWHARERAAGQARELARAGALLEGAGVAVVVVKSACTAPRYFPEEATRLGADVDLVVAGSEHERARAALVAGGYVVRGGQRSPRKTELAHPASEGRLRSLELAHRETGFGVDLHDSLDRDFFGVRRVSVSPTETPAELRSVSEPDGSGSSARLLRQPYLLAYHALHASEGLENLTLIRLVELVLMIRADRRAGRLEWAAVRNALEEADGLAFAYPALRLAEELAPGTVDGDVLSAMRTAAPPRMRRVVDALRPWEAQRLESLSLEERFMWSATALEHVRRVAHMLVPASAGGSPGRVVRTYGERLFRLARRRVALRRDAGDPEER